MSGTFTPGSPPTSDNGTPARATAGPRPLSDQEQFDTAVDRNGRIVLLVLAGIGVFAALVMSTLALVLVSQSHTTTMSMPTASGSVAATPSVLSPSGRLISLSVAGSNKRGPDGKMHDSFSKTNFAVKVGQPIHLRIDNKDGSPHSITAAGTGVNITVRPGLHTYTLVATKAGRFEWVCVIPCDSDANGWAMTHPGYMAGYITASA